MATGALSNVFGSLTKRLFYQIPYSGGVNNVTITLPDAPLTGTTYLVFFLYYTGETTVTMDVRVINYSSPTSIRSMWLVKNSNFNLTGITPSGNNVTFSFAESIYVSTFFVRINGS